MATSSAHGPQQSGIALLFWLLAVLSLGGGLILAKETEQMFFAVAGVVSFAIYGGAAAAIQHLHNIDRKHGAYLQSIDATLKRMESKQKD